MNDQVTREETAEILRLAEQTITNGIEGDFVELGCYRGDTSVLIGKLLQQYEKDNSMPRIVPSDDEPSKAKTLWLYDSFAGLPEKTREDASGAGANFQKGELLVTKREVVDKLRKHGLKTSSSPIPNAFSVIVKKAWFDGLTPQDLPDQIAFAFCDGDLYSSIKTSLSLVKDRLVERGIIIIHDYNNPELPGSAKAVDEFLRSNPNFRLQVRHTLAILKQIPRSESRSDVG